jgi:hypothetical protein
MYIDTFLWIAGLPVIVVLFVVVMLLLLKVSK